MKMIKKRFKQSKEFSLIALEAVKKRKTNLNYSNIDKSIRKIRDLATRQKYEECTMDTNSTTQATRVAEIVNKLSLEKHVEGGYFKKAFASSRLVKPEDGSPETSALTHMYYLLPKGEVSMWHKLKSAEIWHYYEGDAVELTIFDEISRKRQKIKLGALSDEAAPCFLVPEGWWQSARPLGEYTLIGCSVAPGFRWEDWSELPKGVKDPEDLVQ